MMLQGKVTYFNATRGFGFIRPNSPDNAEEVFFHATSVIGRRTLAKDQIVQFELKNTTRGKAAVDVVEAQ